MVVIISIISEWKLLIEPLTFGCVIWEDVFIFHIGTKHPTMCPHLRFRLQPSSQMNQACLVLHCKLSPCLHIQLGFIYPCTEPDMFCLWSFTSLRNEVSNTPNRLCKRTFIAKLIVAPYNFLLAWCLVVLHVQDLAPLT